MPLITRAGLTRAFANVSASALCFLFALAHFTAFRQHPRASLALAVVVEGLFACFMLVRNDSARTSTSVWDWVTASVGVLMPLLLRPTEAAHDVAAGQVLQTFGSSAAVFGVISLNRSAGIVPSNRGIRSQGLYRWVRHPLYASYLIATAGYLMSNVSVRNALVLALSLAAQLLRIGNEERLLSEDATYAAYKARTRWRLLPFVY